MSSQGKYPESGDAKSCSDKSFITKLTLSDIVSVKAHHFFQFFYIFFLS